MVTKFKDNLAKSNLAKNTVTSYVWTVQYFLSHYGEVNKKNLLAYKGYLVENFKPQTVNLRLQGINKYLEFTKQEKLKVKFVKVQQKNFLENVISDADYKFLKTRLKADGYDEWYSGVDANGTPKNQVPNFAYQAKRRYRGDTLEYSFEIRPSPSYSRTVNCSCLSTL